ncbi:glycerophosphodiester phosphodiesterase [Cohnella cholangitidis]|uniref:Glycerophosphodiester phosphodiesterase n=1 Tax=Cohnella cholangitidis TaxID=2598458 RepID=A0A7G5BSN5_9BACL|nr:glycerophosphodiester phosphodiesterase [Cohnella cholangitidis]QMV39969.1 glycerophosphodiester phosphodiesterase [Cohnella cholangitidis]
MLRRWLKPMEIPRLYFYVMHVFLLLSIAGFIIWLTGNDSSLRRAFSSESKIATVAHRGASGYAPESTLAAYRLGIRMKADYIEIDLQETKDGELIALHDETVNRTTNGSGRVKNMTLAEIKALDAGSWFNEKHEIYAREEYVNEKIPTLREIFEAFGKGTNYMLETKSPDENPGMEEKMWALVEEFDLIDHVAVQSFSQESLIKIREWNKDIPLFQLLWYNRPAYISDAFLAEIGSYANGVGANFLRIDESYVHKVKNAGLLMYPYTVNYQVNMDKALRWGVDGVHTDYPDRFKEVIEEELEDAGG